MAVVIDLQGEIGWEIWPEDVKKKLKAAGEEDITVRFSSVGGSVFSGSDIMSMFIDHKRDNKGVKMDLEIKAIAASMGSAIASLSVWDSISINRTSSFMIHNPSDIAFGDFRDMQASARFLEDMRDVYSSLYSDRSGKPQSEIDSMMDSETWFFGDEIVNNGFADRVIDETEPGGEPLKEEDIERQKSIIFLEMKDKRKEMKKRIAELGETEKFDHSKAAACLKSISLEKPETPGKPDEIKPVPAGNLKTEVPMNLEELKKDHPDLYAEMKAEGAKEYRDNNDERMKSLSAMKASDDYKDIPEVVAVIEASMVDGSSVHSTETKINAAMVKIMRNPARMAAIESPGDLQSGDEQPTKPVMKSKVAEV